MNKSMQRDENNLKTENIVKESVLHVRDATISAPDGTKLINGVTFTLHKESCVSLVGANGCGKSTLMKAIAQVDSIEIDSGEISTEKRGQIIEYVPQYTPQYLMEKTLFEATFENLQAKRGDIGEEWKAYIAITKLGFQENQFETKFKDLSGGEVNRALLSRAIVVEPDLILLDEPTNHLDTEGIILFETVLKKVEIPFLVISHDRSFLDRFTKRTLFLAYRKIYSFDLPYSQARVEFDNAREALIKLSEEQKIRRDEIAESTRRLQGFAKNSDRMAGAYRASVTKLGRFEKEMIEVPQDEIKRKISIQANDFNGQRLMHVHQYTVKVPGTDKILYEINDFSIEPRDRVAIMGVNGAGKSTFLNILVQIWRTNESTHLDETGIRFNPQVKLGYYDQKLLEMDLSLSLYDFINDKVHLSREQVHATLAGAGFPYRRHNHLVGSLSGGEKARLQLLAINKTGTNLLVLDEPTNHLDVGGIEQLEDELSHFGGSAILVSHDRTFVEKVANKLYLIRENSLEQIENIEVYFSYIKSNQEQMYIPKTVKSSKPSSRKHVQDVAEDESLLENLYLTYFKLEGALKSTTDKKIQERLQKQMNQIEERLN